MKITTIKTKDFYKTLRKFNVKIENGNGSKRKLTNLLINMNK